MALPHAQAFDRIDLRPLGERLAAAVTTSLIKTPSLQLMRLVLHEGDALPTHQVHGEITLQCIEGRAAVTTPGRHIELSAGDLLLLPGAEPHAVRAMVDCSLLVTISLLATPP